MKNLFMRTDASFSECGTYRYWLLREWDADKPRVVFVMLNPSTAGSVEDDPTIRRCKGFAADWGFGSLGVVNLFALRSTDPAKLLHHKDPVGSINDRHLWDRMTGAARIVAAWGAIKKRLAWRVKEIQDIFDRLGGPVYCLGTTRDGSPRHPLYVSAATKLVHWP